MSPHRLVSPATLSTIASFRAIRKTLPHSSTVGFVPTMGALHAGHLSLVEAARSQNDVVVASVFVNPAQFGPNEDLQKYPRQLEVDTALLMAAGVDLIFAPNAGSMYGEHHVTYVDPGGFDATREGQQRPDFFRGVATIVTKLFNIVKPTDAYFGQKDAAQCALIRRIVEVRRGRTKECLVKGLREHELVCSHANKDRRRSMHVRWSNERLVKNDRLKPRCSITRVPFWLLPPNKLSPSPLPLLPVPLTLASILPFRIWTWTSPCTSCRRFAKKTTWP